MVTRIIHTSEDTCKARLHTFSCFNVNQIAIYYLLRFTIVSSMPLDNKNRVCMCTTQSEVTHLICSLLSSHVVTFLRESWQILDTELLLLVVYPSLRSGVMPINEWPANNSSEIH